MDIKELVEAIRDYTSKSDMPFERYLMLTEAADTLEKLSSENKQLRANLIMQTALAQNGQSAIETNKQLKRHLNAAIADIKKAVDDEILCNFCKHDAPCQGEKCDKYIEGRGMTFEKTGQYVDEKWTCMDFNFGECPKLEDTPCNECFDNNMSGFEWRGVKCE